MPLRVHNDVGRLDVAMNDSLAVRGIECAGQLQAYLEDLRAWQRPSGSPPL